MTQHRSDIISLLSSPSTAYVIGLTSCSSEACQFPHGFWICAPSYIYSHIFDFRRARRLHWIKQCLWSIIMVSFDNFLNSITWYLTNFMYVVLCLCLIFLANYYFHVKFWNHLSHVYSEVNNHFLMLFDLLCLKGGLMWVCFLCCSTKMAAVLPGLARLPAKMSGMLC